jgi:hypothetical protein
MTTATLELSFMDADDATASASSKSATEYACATSLDHEDDPAPQAPPERSARTGYRRMLAGLVANSHAGDKILDAGAALFQSSAAGFSAVLANIAVRRQSAQTRQTTCNNLCAQLGALLV